MKATIVGNLGQDCEVKKTNTGKTVCNFSVADSVGYGDDKKVQWVRCAMFGERGEKLKQYLVKGQGVVVFGDVAVNEYQDKNGCNKSSIDCNVTDVKLVGGSGKKSDSSTSSASQNHVQTDDVPF